MCARAQPLPALTSGPLLGPKRHAYSVVFCFGPGGRQGESSLFFGDTLWPEHDVRSFTQRRCRRAGGVAPEPLLLPLCLSCSEAPHHALVDEAGFPSRLIAEPNPHIYIYIHI